jgi:hypothetical protein
LADGDGRRLFDHTYAWLGIVADAHGLLICKIGGGDLREREIASKYSAMVLIHI